MGKPTEVVRKERQVRIVGMILDIERYWDKIRQ